MKPTGRGPQGGAAAGPDRGYRAASAAPDMGFLPGSFAQRPATAPASNSPNRPAPCAHQRVLLRSTIPPSIREVPGRDTSLFIGGRRRKGQGVPDKAGDGGVAGVSHRLRHAAGWRVSQKIQRLRSSDAPAENVWGVGADPVAMPAAPASATWTICPWIVRAVRNSLCVFSEGVRAVLTTGQTVPKDPGRLLCVRLVEIGNRILARGQTAAELNLRARLIAL